MKTKIETILNEVLPKSAFRFINERESGLSGKYIVIFFAANAFDINKVGFQKPQAVSLILYTKTMELKPQIFGGNGGQSIYRKPNMNDDREKYLAMKSVKIPFRKPKPEEKNVLECIKRFAENWLQTLKDNRSELMYSNYVDYDELLG